MGHEPVGDEPSEHLARGLGRHAEMPGDLGGGDSASLNRPSREVSSRYCWAAFERSCGSLTRRHAPQDTERPARGSQARTQARATRSRCPRTSHEEDDTEHPARASMRRRPAARNAVDGQGGEAAAMAPEAAIAASRGTRSRAASTTTRQDRSDLAMPPSQVAANRPHPVTSPMNHPSPRARPYATRTWTRRHRPLAERSSVSARPG